MTGRASTETGCVWNTFGMHRDRMPLLGEWLQDRGYHTAYFGKLHCPGAKEDKVFEQTLGLSALFGQHDDPLVAQAAETFLLSQPLHKPFFLGLGFHQPHDNNFWLFEHYRRMEALPCAEIADELPPLPASFHARPTHEPRNIGRIEPGGPGYPASQWTELQWRYYLWAYYRMVEMVDAEIGRVLDALADSPHARNTLVIFSADHGEANGELGLLTKGFLYDSAARVPLVVSWPGHIPEGERAEVTADWRLYVEEYVEMMREPTYQRVVGARPLLYLYQPGRFGHGSLAAGGKDAPDYGRLSAAIGILRSRLREADVGNPYVVGMLGGSDEPAELMQRGLVDAVSLYHYRYGGKPELPYAELWPAVERDVLNGRLGGPGLQVIPPLMSGANWLPRWRVMPQIFPPWNWGEPQPGELGRHIAAGLDYVSTHPDRCGASSVIIYAWNEHSEGGFNNPGTGRRGYAIQYRAGDGEPEAFVFTIRPAEAGSRLDLRRLEVAAQSVSKGSGAEVSVSAGVTEVGTARIEGGDWARLAFALPPHLRAAADEVVVRLLVSGSGAGAVRLDDLRLRGHVRTRE
jgi:hypothetical protein